MSLMPHGFRKGSWYTRSKEEPPARLIESEFLKLAKQWREETCFMSSITIKSMHPAYQRIIGMGSQVVPLILRELKRKPEHWFWALTAITGEDPVSPDDAGNIEKMTKTWLEFGRRQGYFENE